MDREAGEQVEALRHELAAAREELRAARDHLTMFAGQVGHDLRTPLTAILANAEMLSGEPAVQGSEDLRWMVDGLTRAARRLNTMIEQMLGYARHGGVPTLRVVDLGRVFEAAVDDLAPLVAEKDAVVKVGELPRLPADRDQMYAVALNLLHNGLTFSRPGTPPWVEVSADRDGDRWRVSVSDNGIGIAPDRREAMFVLFARADKRLDGSGIGLAVARRLVEAHGGRIGLEGAADGGTTVWFELPA